MYITAARRSLEKTWASCSLAVVALAVSVVPMGRCGSFVAVDGKLLDGLVREAGLVGQPAVSRNRLGTKLFLTGRTADRTTVVEIISQQGVELKRFASGRPVVDDNGELVAWVTNGVSAVAAVGGAVKALAFAAGGTTPIVFTNDVSTTFGFSPGGEYFFLNQARNPAGLLPGWASAPQPVIFLTPGATNAGRYAPRWKGVYLTSSPTEPLFRLPNDFYGTAIFTQSNQIVVSGSKAVYGIGAPDLVGSEAWALVFSKDGSSYKLAGQLDLSRFNDVLDLDPSTGMLLVRGKGDLFARWGLFDTKTGKYKSLGEAGAHGFFLDPGFSKYLESRWN